MLLNRETIPASPHCNVIGHLFMRLAVLLVALATGWLHQLITYVCTHVPHLGIASEPRPNLNLSRIQTWAKHTKSLAPPSKNELKA